MTAVEALTGLRVAGRLREVIEEELGRKVAGFMSGSHQHPDLLGEIFILEPESGEFRENVQAGDDIPGG
jgi:hypothetical protein